jgi:plasmid maintenance system antidote protein VapI
MAELPEHPGPWIRDVLMPALRPHGYSNGRVAELLGVGRQHFQEMLAGRASITAAQAARLALMMGGQAGEMFACQMARHELALELAQLGDNVRGALPDLSALPFAPGERPAPLLQPAAA